LFGGVKKRYIQGGLPDFKNHANLLSRAAKTRNHLDGDETRFAKKRTEKGLPMPATLRKPHDELSEPARIARLQWQRDCFRRESRRAQELVRVCHDKFAFAGAYLAASRSRAQTLARVQSEIEAGDFAFFTAGSVPIEVLDRTTAERLLHDWDNGMISYLTVIEERFEMRFHQDLGEFLAIWSRTLPIPSASSPDQPSDAQTISRAEEPTSPSDSRVDVCA
jgi:hypothetical protein